MKESTLFLDDPWLSLAGISLVVILLYGELFFHELGHWLFSRLLGYHIVGFSTGQGPLFRQHLDPSRPSFRQFRLWPVGGYVLPVRLHGRESRLQHFLVYCAGPLFSLLFALAIFAVLRGVNFAAFPHPWETVLRQVCQITLVLVGISILYNAIPNPTLSQPNDGLGMLRSITKPDFPRPPYPESTIRHSLLADGLCGEPLIPVQITSAGTRALLLQLYHKSLGQWSEAGENLEATLADKAISSGERVTLLDACADLVIDHQLRNHGPRAIRALEEATQILPDSLILRVRLAACQILESFYEDGRRRLNYLETETDNPHILACIACARAIAEARQGRTPQARELYAQARKLHRHCDLAHLAAVVIWGDSEAPG